MQWAEPAEDEFDDLDAAPSRTQLKREAHALQDLAEALTHLPRERWTALSQIDDSVRAAVAMAVKISAHGAKRRQLRYIAGLLRHLEEDDLALLRRSVAGEQADKAVAAQRLHRIEGWRDRLLNEGDAALSDLLADYPHADSQALRQLLRNAQKERVQNKPPRSARLIFQALKALLDAPEDD